MGRVKLKIKRLESNTSRLTTYSKRKNGLIKKANELSVLCDIDVVLLMFSPSGRPVLWKGRNSSIEGIIERFSELNPQERAKRKLEIFDALKRSYGKSDHKVNVQDFFASSCQTIGDLAIQANLLQTQLSQIQKRLSDWNNLDKIDSFELLEQMQDYIRELLDQIQTQKENIGKQQYLPLRSTNQFQHGMHLPFSLGFEDQVQQFSRIQNDDCQHMGSLKEPNMLPNRETEHSASHSFRNCSGHFGTFEKAEIASTGQENGVLSELLRTEALRNELIGLKTETLRNELTKTESLKNELIKKELSKHKLSNSSEIFCTLQFQHGMHRPFGLGVEHQLQHFSWIQNDGSQHMVQPKEPDLFPTRETGLSAGNSFRKCSGQIDTVEKAEIAGIGQQNDVLSELLSTESLRNELIGFKTETLMNELTKTVFLKNKFLKADSLGNKLSKIEFLTNELIKTEGLMNKLIKTESLRNELKKADSLRIELMKTESLRSEFIRTESLRNELIEAESLKLRPYEQYSYQHCNFNILPDKKFQPAQQTNLQQSTDDYCDEGIFESSESVYDFTHCNWASTSGPSVIPAFDEQLYSQQHCSTAGFVAEKLGP